MRDTDGRGFDRRRFLAVASRSALLMPVAGLIGCELDQPAAEALAQSILPPAPRPAVALPEWFVADRVHAHTRLGFRQAFRPEYLRGMDVLADLGARVITRHVKSGAESPGWPTRFEPSERPRGDAESDLIRVRQQDMVRRAIDATHAAGMRFIAYYWHMSDAALERTNAGLVCRRANGSVLQTPRGPALDITDPVYRDIVLERLRELAEMGADGFYFDSSHLPQAGCSGTTVEREYRAAAQASGDAPDFLHFQAGRIADTFAYWKAGIGRTHPHVVFVVSTAGLAALTLPNLDTRLAALVDSPKTEFRTALRPGQARNVFENGELIAPDEQARMAFGWTMLRDAADGRPPHVWSPPLTDARQARRFVAGTVAWGGIANVDVPETSMLSRSRRDAGVREAYSAAFELGRTISPVLANATPVRWAAVHFPEQARDRHGENATRAWRDVLLPTVVAFATLARHGVPVGVVTDEQLSAGSLDGVAVLLLPAPALMDPTQRRAASRFGGTVIANEGALRWSASDDAMALNDRIAALARTAPLRASGLGPGTQAVFHRDGSTLIAALCHGYASAQAIRSEEDPAAVGRYPELSNRITITVNGTFARVARARDVTTGGSLAVTRAAGGVSVTVPPLRDLALIELLP